MWARPDDFGYVDGLGVDASGRVYVQAVNGGLQQLSPDGTIAPWARIFGNDVTIDPQGNVWADDGSSGTADYLQGREVRIDKLSSDGKVISSWTGPQ